MLKIIIDFKWLWPADCVQNLKLREEKQELDNSKINVILIGLYFQNIFEVLTITRTKLLLFKKKE